VRLFFIRTKQNAVARPQSFPRAREGKPGGGGLFLVQQNFNLHLTALAIKPRGNDLRVVHDQQIPAAQ
jgi:hypothetical protein